MPLVERFEDLECWQEARALVTLVFRACEQAPLSKDFETRAQFKGAALSVMNNIAEGFGRRFNTKDFIRFLDISQSSSLEVKSMTYALEDVKYLSAEHLLPIRTKTDLAGKKVLGLIEYLRTRRR